MAGLLSHSLQGVSASDSHCCSHRRLCCQRHHSCLSPPGHSWVLSRATASSVRLCPISASSGTPGQGGYSLLHLRYCSPPDPGFQRPFPEGKEITAVQQFWQLLPKEDIGISLSWPPLQICTARHAELAAAAAATAAVALPGKPRPPTPEYPCRRCRRTGSHTLVHTPAHSSVHVLTHTHSYSHSHSAGFSSCLLCG